jgi:hypothetical protein
MSAATRARTDQEGRTQLTLAVNPAVKAPACVRAGQHRLVYVGGCAQLVASTCHVSRARNASLGTLYIAEP